MNVRHAVTAAPLRSEFRAKGVMYRGVSAYLDAHVPGGVAAAVATLQEEHRAFFAQPFLAASWYDIAPLVPFVDAAARASGGGFLDLMRAASVAQAERDMGGIYRVLLALASPDMVVERLPRTANQYFDFVRVELQREGPKHWTSTLSGIPEFAAPIYLPASGAFVATALARAGAKDVEVTASTPEPDGEARGRPVVRVRRTMRWK